MKALTTKQRHLLKVICMGNLDKKGNRVSNVDYGEIISRVPYETSRESLMCSIRILEQQGWITRPGKEYRDGKMKQLVEPTQAAIRVINPVVEKEPEYVEIGNEDDDFVLLELD